MSREKERVEEESLQESRKIISLILLRNKSMK
jgi:hypothetical protein